MFQHTYRTGKKLYEHIWKNRVETLKVSVPAVVYAIQNNLYYIALANIDATTYSVIFAQNEIKKIWDQYTKFKL